MTPERSARKDPGRFQQIWRLVAGLPAGYVATYGDIADAVSPPCNPRLIGKALGAAPPGLRLPWHRVLAAAGRISLPGESGLEQRRRLEFEGVAFRGRRVDMRRHHYQGLTTRHKG